MAFPNDELFLERFIAYNKRRYSSNPEFVAKLSTLTLANTTFFNFRKVQGPGSVVVHYVDVDSPAILVGTDQQYLPADYTKHGPAELVDEAPYVKDDLQIKTVQGVYFLGTSEEDSVGAVVMLQGQVNVPALKQLIQEKCLFILKDSEITVSEDMTFVTIDSRTIAGVVQVVESLYDGVNRYNGVFRYDGTITY